MKHRSDIDGLRAVAVLPVMFYHSGMGFSGGFVGVDVFFVISGYLITGLISEEVDRGTFNIVQFWERRVRRIMPALAVVVMTSLALGWFLFLAHDFQELGQSVASQALLISNIYFWRESNYFAQASEVKPLLHTWSLAVEEQFYLLFPILFVALKRHAQRALLPAIVLIGSISLILSIYLSYTNSLANFYLLPTRAWELLLGSLLVCVPSHRLPAKVLNEVLSSLGLVLVGCAIFLYGRDTRFPGMAALLPCMGAALIIWTNEQGLTAAGRLLATRPAVFIGLISYSLYLWHWPVLVFSRYWASSPASAGEYALLFVIVMGLAVLSWRFVETPFRKRTFFKDRGQIFSFAFASSAVLLCAGFAIHKLRGVPSRIPVEAQTYADGVNDYAFRNQLGLKEALRGEFFPLGNGDGQQPVSILVWGDSHALAVMSAVDSLCKENSLRGVGAAHFATAPLVGYESHDAFSLKENSGVFNNAIVEFIRGNYVKNVLLTANWNAYIDADHGIERLRAGVLATINALKDSGVKIWFMKDVPIQQVNVPKALASAVLFGGVPEALGLPMGEHSAASRLQDQLFDHLAAPNVMVLDPTLLFVGGTGLCRMAVDGKALYTDDSHLTTAGAMLLRPLFEPIFALPKVVKPGGDP